MPVWKTSSPTATPAAPAPLPLTTVPSASTSNPTISSVISHSSILHFILLTPPAQLRFCTLLLQGQRTLVRLALRRLDVSAALTGPEAVFLQGFPARPQHPPHLAGVRPARVPAQGNRSPGVEGISYLLVLKLDRQALGGGC